MSVKHLMQRLGVGLLALSLFGQSCTGGPDAAAIEAAKPSVITVWAVVDDVYAYEKIFADFRRLYPYVTVDFRRFRMEEYEDFILNALAEDKGPDMFLVHNTWIDKYQSKILPMPPAVNLAEQKVVGTIKKEVTYVMTPQATVRPYQFREDYPDTVGFDLIRKINVSTVSSKQDYQDRIMAVPMSVDTLAMYVNKDLLNAAGIATVPTEWVAVQEAAKKMTKQNTRGDIVQSGVAMGTGLNVERAPDLLAALMMQNGAQMMDENGMPTFNRVPSRLADVLDEPPAYQALRFYTDFANPGKEVYNWNNSLPNSVDAFIQGRAAFFFGYSYHLPLIKARAPKMNLGISKLPQIDGAPVANVANYWAWTVSQKARYPDLSWALINFMRKPEENIQFLETVKRPAALKSQLDVQLEDPDVAVFAAQVLTAHSWYRGANARVADAAMVEMIEGALTNDEEEIGRLINTAVQKITQTVGYTGF